MAIQQHPLPQDITSYRFRLIGDMTIKQFAYLAGFAIAGIIAYNTPLPFFFRYPLAFILVLLGIGIAFVPIQGRSMETWIIAFIRSIYSPTQYVWRQEPTTTSTPVTTPSTTITPPKVAPVVPPSPTVSPTLPQNETTSNTVTTQTPPPTAKSVSTTPASSTPTPETITPQSSAPTTNLPIPFTPTTPNTLVGLTLTPDGKILDSVMVEIQNKGVTIRATKSNRLGQFMFARPLENGLYQILADKDGVQFSTYTLDLKGDIVKPLKIQANS